MVRDQEVRDIRSPGVHQEPHQARQVLRLAGEERLQVRGGQRRQTGVGLLQAVRSRRRQQDAPGDGQRLGETPHDTVDGEGEVHHQVLRGGGKRHRCRRRVRLAGHQGARERADEFAREAGDSGRRGEAAAHQAEVAQVLLHQERVEGNLQEDDEQEQPVRRRHAHFDTRRRDRQPHERGGAQRDHQERVPRRRRRLLERVQRVQHKGGADIGGGVTARRPVRVNRIPR